MRKLACSCKVVGVMAVACFIAFAASASADDAADGRAICAKYCDAVVRVQVVVKTTYSYGGESDSHESKSEVVGTVIDPSGLTVTSLTCTDPSSSGPEEDGEYSASSEMTDVKILLADGKEIPAQVVLRDRDLDLAFIRPITKPTSPMPYVDLKVDAKADLLEPVITVTRLGKVANRTLSACIEHIEAIVEKPRKFYTVSMSSIGDEYGAPVFSMGGKPIGIVLYREMPGGNNYDESNWIPVVIPAEDILRVAVQAPERAAETTSASTNNAEDSAE